MSKEPTDSNKPPGKKKHHPNRDDGKRDNNVQRGQQHRRHNIPRPQQSHKVDMRKYEKLLNELKSNFSDIKPSGGTEQECTICCKCCDIFGLGECRHPVCIECAIRMRVLNQQITCPVCRQENDIIYLVYAKNDLEKMLLNFPKHGHPAEDRFAIRFENKEVGERYEQYLAHVCKICKTSDGDRLEFQTFNALRQHMANLHKLSYCNMCTDNLNLERKTYSSQTLQRHLVEGDAEDQSQRGHPTCLFCDQRFFDIEGQYRHLRKDHFYCQFCESDGTMTNSFFGNHEALLKHYKMKHFLCEHADCRSLGIAFSTPVEFNLHKTQHTGKGVQLDFQYNDRQPVGHGRARRDRDGYRPQPNERIAVVPVERPTPPPPRPDTEIIVVPSAQSRNIQIGRHHAYNHRLEEFPTLGGAPGTSNVTYTPQVVVPQEFPRLNKVGKAVTSQKQPPKKTEDFPSLGGRTGASSSSQKNDAKWGKHTGNFAMIDDDERVESSSKSQPIQNITPPIRSNQQVESQTRKPQKQAEPVRTEDFPSLPSNSGAAGLAAKSNWAAKAKGKNAITGLVMPKKKNLPVPDIWPERSTTTPTADYKPAEDTWENVPFNRKLTVRERRELEKKKLEAEMMEQEDTWKEIEEKMMVPPDEDLEMQEILMNDTNNTRASSSRATTSKKSKKGKAIQLDQNVASRSNDNPKVKKENKSPKKDQTTETAIPEAFPSLQSTIQGNQPKPPSPEPTPEPAEKSAGISSWIFSSVSNALGSLSLSNVLGDHSQPLSSMTTESTSIQDKSTVEPPPGIPSKPLSSTEATISFNAPPGFENFVPSAALSNGPPPGLDQLGNTFLSAPILSHQDLIRPQPQKNADGWSYANGKAKKN